MSYVGKILVIVQVVMSLLFMTFAAAVYTMHVNWQQKYIASQAALTTAQGQVRDAQTELTNAKSQFLIDFGNEQTAKNEYIALNTTLKNQVDALTAERDLLENQRDREASVAVAKAGEAGFRQEEAERLRVVNAQVQATVDTQAADLRKRADEYFALEERFLALNRLYEASIKQMAFLKQVVAKNKLETDPDKVAERNLPAPPVDGIVTGVQTNRSNRVARVNISIGSDDGLKMGDTLSVYRAVGVKSADWLGTIKVVSISPDSAVADVVLPAKNGIIQESDNVTTRF